MTRKADTSVPSRKGIPRRPLALTLVVLGGLLWLVWWALVS